MRDLGFRLQGVGCKKQGETLGLLGGHGSQGSP